MKTKRTSRMMKGAIWVFVLTVSLSSGESAVTCKDKNNGEVDWYILYKKPNGSEYHYIDSKKNTFEEKNIRDFLAKTLEHLFSSPLKTDFGFISYNDQPPNKQASDAYGHSKGVVMVQKDTTGVWLLHSTPQFPFERDQNKFFPATGEKNAQTFICVTFKYSEFKKIGNHLQYINANCFDHHIPEDFHEELKQAKPPQTLTSRGGQTFTSFTKKMSSKAKDGDLYVMIADHLKSDLDVQTWGCQRHHDDPYCTGYYKVFNILTIDKWKNTNDHSKWCVAKNKDSVCIADVNRSQSQYKRRGGALCIKDKEVKQFFGDLIHSTDDCKPPHRKRKHDCDDGSS